MPDSLISLKGSDSGLHIQLHPLVILSISDHITRHAACQQGHMPIIGALLGQQHGRDISLEHAFECIVVEGPDGELSLPPDWFIERVKQFKDVHKDPPLDIVGWWATAPPTGPTPSHLPIQRQILQDYNESAVFLAFHPSQLQNAPSSGGKLPLTVYESVYEGDQADGEKKMQVDDEEQSLNIRFRELPYSVETGETEMIGIDTVSRSGRTAVVNDGSGQQPQQKGSNTEAEGKETEATILSAEDEELIASLNTRLNAIRTLESRISLIKSYLSTLSSPSEDTTNLEPQQHLFHPILRNINSVLSHLSLLTPPGESPLTAETLLQNNDVLLVSMLGELSKSIKGMRDVGRKAGIVRSAKQNAMTRNAQFAMQSRFEDEYLTKDGDGGSVPLAMPNYT